MKAGLVVAVALTLSLVTVACDGGPPEGRTGIAIVDTVLDAVEEGDQEALKPLIRLVEAGCLRNVPTELEPLCTDDEATGTIVQTFARGSCVGLIAGRETADGVAGGIVSQDLSLYAVYEAPSDYHPPAQYVLLFGKTDPAEDPVVVRGLALSVSGDRIVGTNEECGNPPGEFVGFLGLTDVVLAPD